MGQRVAARRCSAFRCSSTGPSPIGRLAPTYYLQCDAPLYYYSFTDAQIASAYRSLPKDDQARFDPMITGFNPADMYGRITFAGCCNVSRRVHRYRRIQHSQGVRLRQDSRRNRQSDQPRPRSHSRFRGDVGLVAIIHNDIDMPFAKTDAEPVYLAQMKALLKRHPRTSIIWAHTGLGRIVDPVQVSADAAQRPPTQFEIVETMLKDPALNHVNFDISWDEVGRYAVATPQSIARVVATLNRYPDRFLFGTDTVAPRVPSPITRSTTSGHPSGVS